MMKPAILKRKCLELSVILFAILSCNGQDISSDQLEGTWTKTANGRSVTFTISPDLSCGEIMKGITVFMHFDPVTQPAYTLLIFPEIACRPLK